MLEPLPVPLSALEASCRAYMAAPDPEKHFSINDVTVDPELIEREKKAAAAKAKAAAVASGEEPASPAANPAVQQAQANEADLLSKLPHTLGVASQTWLHRCSSYRYCPRYTWRLPTRPRQPLPRELPASLRLLALLFAVP